MSYPQPGQPRGRRGPRAGRPSAPPRGSAIIVAGAVLAVLAMTLVVVIERRQSRSLPSDASGAWMAPPVAGPSPALIPLQSDPPSPTPSPSPPPTAAATGKPLPVARPSSSAPSSRPPARLLPEPGSRISLVATGRAGLRLRHQDFRMRLSAIGPRSPAPARADATFVLRRGLADARCVSLESVNFPGRFVRHRNFAAVLQPREPSRVFAADATFCPLRVGSGGDFVLRSSNFPDRFLTTDGPSVLLGRPATAAAAQRFRAVPGL